MRGLQPGEAVTSRAEHGAFSFPAGFKVPTQYHCAEIIIPRGANLPLVWASLACRQLLRGSGKASRCCWQRGIGRGMLCEALTKMESHLVITQCGLGCDEPKITTTALRHMVQILN